MEYAKPATRRSTYSPHLHRPLLRQHFLGLDRHCLALLVSDVPLDGDHHLDLRHLFLFLCCSSRARCPACKECLNLGVSRWIVDKGVLIVRLLLDGGMDERVVRGVLLLAKRCLARTQTDGLARGWEYRYGRAGGLRGGKAGRLQVPISSARCPRVAGLGLTW